MSDKKTITCPKCGNDDEFVGEPDSYPIFRANNDGGLDYKRSEPTNDRTKITCGDCGADLPNHENLEIKY